MILDHVESLSTLSRHRVDALSMDRDIPASCALEDYDAVIIHYSIFISQDNYLSPLSRYRLRQFDGPKVLFIQDEYRFVEKTIEAISYLGIDLVFTCVPEDQIKIVYPTVRLPRCRFVTVLTGYVPDRLRSLPALPFAARPVDICYRGREYPIWHGELGRDRTRIAEWFNRHAPDYGLAIDISTRECDRIYGPAWLEFMARAKAVLGTESGCNVLDVDGTLGERIERYQMLRPWASYEAIRCRFLRSIEGSIHLNQISPRCFEAIATRTLLILYEGAYSDVLQPWIHYVPLRRDHSNAADVVSVLRNAEQATRIIERAHADIIASNRFSYPSFVAAVDDHIGMLVVETPQRRQSRPAPTAASACPVRVKPRLSSVAMQVYVRLPAYVRIWLKHLLLIGVRRARRGTAAVIQITSVLITSGAVRRLAMEGLKLLGPGGMWSMLRLISAARQIGSPVEMRTAANHLLLKPRDADTLLPSSTAPFSVVWTGGSAMGLAGALGSVGAWQYAVPDARGIARLSERIRGALPAPKTLLRPQGACIHGS